MGAPGEDDQPRLRLQLVRCEGELPEGFAALRAEAEAEGYRHLARLAGEASATPDLFVALLAAFDDGEMVAVGGLTADPEAPMALRMRRFYVARRARRQGVATQLANALLAEGLAQGRPVNVHPGDARAERFWTSMGFAPVEDGDALWRYVDDFDEEA